MTTTYYKCYYITDNGEKVYTTHEDRLYEQPRHIKCSISHHNWGFRDGKWVQIPRHYYVEKYTLSCDGVIQEFDK